MRSDDGSRVVLNHLVTTRFGGAYDEDTGGRTYGESMTQTEDLALEPGAAGCADHEERRGVEALDEVDGAVSADCMSLD